ncbi:unnamed protein product, partial [Meganyctiphanes norvegica]
EQKNIEDVIMNINNSTDELDAGHFPASSCPFDELLIKLIHAASQLNEHTSDVLVSAEESTTELATSFKKFSTTFGNLFGVGMEIVGSIKDQEVQQNMVMSLKNVSMTSSKLLVSGKTVATDPNATNAKSQLSNDARVVKDSINDLINVCTTMKITLHEQKDIDDVIKNINNSTNELDAGHFPASSCPFDELLAKLFHSASQLKEQTSDVVVSAKDSTTELAMSSKKFSTTFGDLLIVGMEIVGSIKDQEVQKNMVMSLKSVSMTSSTLMVSGKTVASDANATNAKSQLSDDARVVKDSIDDLIKLVSSIRDKAPGQIECDEAIEKLNLNKHDIDQASLSVQDHNLPQKLENNLQGFNEQVDNAEKSLLNNIDRVRIAAKREPEELGHSIIQFSSYFDPMVKSSIGVTSNLINHKQQGCLLENAKAVVEYALLLINAAKEAGRNPKAPHTHTDVDDSADNLKERLQDLLTTIETISTEASIISGLVESINMAMDHIDENHFPSDDTDGHVDYQTRMFTSTKEISQLAQDMVNKSSDDMSQVAQSVEKISHQYKSLSDDISGAIHESTDPEIAQQLRSSFLELGQSCIELLNYGGVCQAGPCDTLAQSNPGESARQVGEKASHVLAILQASFQGTVACINAETTVSGIIEDLDTSIMFATASTLNDENEDENFSVYRECILKTSKALINEAKTLVAGATSSQEELAVAAQNAITTIVQLSDEVKGGALSLGSTNPESQKMLLNAVKDVAMALGDLINSSKAVSNNSNHEAALKRLKESTELMVTNVNSLTKTVKSVEDEHTRGTHALEAAIEAIAQEIRAFDSDEASKSKATPEDLIRVTKLMSHAATTAVGAGNSLKQDDVIIAANMGRKAISDMLTTCKGAALCAETNEIQNKVVTAGHHIAVQYHKLLQMVQHLLIKPSQEGKTSLTTISNNIAECVTILLSNAESLKDTGSGEDPVNTSIPIETAEKELHGAVESIAVAAQMLMALKPRKAPKK